MKNFIILLLIAGITGYSVARGQTTTGQVVGTVLNKETGEPLPGANVQIKKTFLGAVCNQAGRFKLPPLQPGNFILKVSYIGFKSHETRIQVAPNKVIDITIALESSPIQMDQIIVTGSRQPEELSAAVASISVLRGTDIKARNNLRVDEALLAVPGVSMVGENVNIRGGSGYNRLGGSRVLVLLDEVPILTSDLGMINWNIIPITAVDHIEVLKGAASSLYGSGALTGVINVITKIPDQRHRFSFRQTTGVYDAPSVPNWKWTDKMLYYNRTDLGYGKKFGPMSMRLDLAYHQSTGDREMGKFERWYFTGKSILQLPWSSTLTFFSTYSQDDRDLFLRWIRQNNALNVPVTDRNLHYQIDGFVGYAVLHTLFSPTLSAKLRVSYNRQLVGIPFDISTTSFRPAIGLSSELQMNWLPHPDHSISMGVDYKEDRANSRYYGRQVGIAMSPYIQEIWKISQIWQLNAGLRYDTYTLVGDSVETQLSPKIGASYRPFSGTLVHFSFGRGFRAASVVERFLDISSGGDVKVVPNPNLQPERSTLFDIGVRQTIGRNFFAEFTAFSSYYRNFIELTLIPQNLNVQFLTYPRAIIKGFETSVHWSIWSERINLDASTTWMEPHEYDSDGPLPYRPKFMAFINPSLTLGRFNFQAEFRYVSKLQKVLVFPSDERVPVQVFNFRLGYNLNHLNFQLSVNNAVNYNYLVSERVLGELRNYALSVSGDF